ncbi:hypothetical protein [Streptomyces sp. AC555_RSS877]|uniref:hypothetical protein n=1 Tax=Streptomyces sp. AC555_RSS877 TaxID=2823688 RepID=UPI0020B703E8|nr:hypothetical protein [Streptomyces sp. AC555_RSS877]
MLTARQKPTPWTGRGDVAVRITPDARALERGRPTEGQQPDANPIALVLIHPDTETALTGTLHRARSWIHGAWADPYRLLTHALAGRDLPSDIEARRHLALVLRGRRRDPGLDDRIVAAAIATHCLDISEPKTVRGLEADYRLYTARWDLSDLPARRRPPTPVPGPDRQPPADTGEPAAPRAPGQDAGEWEIPRLPLQYERAALPGAVVREKLRTTTTATAVRSRAYDVVAHQQAAMPEQLLAPPAADPEHDDQDPEVGRQEAIDLTALRALLESRTDVEALDLTAERLPHLGAAFTAAADRARATMDRYAEQDDADAVRPVRQDDQQAHRPQEPGPHRGREAGH